ncbi:MAG: hypothetical protein AAGJ70_02725 [Pseudomonadota bacterium]
MSDLDEASRYDPVRVLITGFGPFPGVPRNISGEIAEAWAAAQAGAAPDRMDVLPFVLPTEWQRAPRAIADCIRSMQPHIALHLGVSARAEGIVLERTAYNACDGRVDEAGHAQRAGCLDVDAPERIETRAPVSELRAALVTDGLRATVSDDPGRYLCNAVYHASLTCSQRTGVPHHALFIHLPVTLADVGMAEADVRAALSLIAGVLREQLPD